ncbi:MAG: hypothetical protein AB7U98_03565 [Candidatus Nitrosocosmicus sp.]
MNLYTKGLSNYLMKIVSMNSKVTTTIIKITTVYSCTIIFAIALLQFPHSTIMAYGQSDTLPFEIGDIIGIDTKSKNMTSNDTFLTDTETFSNEESSSEAGNCVMPPCPPGNACIQSCPEIG